MSALRNAMPNVQFIATTHDPLCLRGMRGGEVQVLVRDEDHHIRVLKGLPDVRGLRAEQLLTSDYFGLSSTADPEIEDTLKAIAHSSNDMLTSEIEIREALRPIEWIGETRSRQVVNEALRRFIEESSSPSAVDRGVVREQAVVGVLEGLRALRVRRAQ
jgi:predicted ATP-binding protein involved in virulence